MVGLAESWMLVARTSRHERCSIIKGERIRAGLPHRNRLLTFRCFPLQGLLVAVREDSPGEQGKLCQSNFLHHEGASSNSCGRRKSASATSQRAVLVYGAIPM